MTKKELNTKANRYMGSAQKRFRAAHSHLGEDAQECGFCNGFTWGAVSGYKAGFRAAAQPKNGRSRLGRQLK